MSGTTVERSEKRKKKARKDDQAVAFLGVQESQGLGGSEEQLL